MEKKIVCPFSASARKYGVFPDEIQAISFNLVSYSLKFFIYQIPGTAKPGRVLKVVVKLPGAGREYRTPLPGVVADCYDQVKVHISVFIDVVGGMPEISIPSFFIAAMAFGLTPWVSTPAL